MALSAGILGFCGTFYAQYVLLVDPPSVLAGSISIIIALVAIFGGIGTVSGPIIGSFVLISLSEYSRDYFSGSGRNVDLLIYGALIITLPVLTYQLYAFVLPAFPEEHHKHIKPMVWSVPILFLLGVVFAWYLVVPPAFDFLINFNQEQFNVQLRAKEYIQFVLLTLLAMGLVFEMPMVMMTLGRLGVVSSAMMKRHWRISIVALAVLAMLLPGVDPISYIVEFIPLLVLYGLSYFLVKLVEPKPASPPQSEPTPG